MHRSIPLFSACLGVAIFLQCDGHCDDLISPSTASDGQSLLLSLLKWMIGRCVNSAVSRDIPEPFHSARCGSSLACGSRRSLLGMAHQVQDCVAWAALPGLIRVYRQCLDLCYGFSAACFVTHSQMAEVCAQALERLCYRGEGASAKHCKV